MRHCSRLTLVAACILAILRSATANPVGTVDVIKTSPAAEAAGLVTCNLFVQFDNPSDKLLSVGFANISTNAPGGFYQHEFGSDLAPNSVICAIPGFELLCSDSFVTIGAKDSQFNTSAVDPTFNPAAFNPPPPQNMVIGGWFNANSQNSNGVPDANLRVLIAQFTVAYAPQFIFIGGPLTVYYNQGQACPTFVQCFSDPCSCDWCNDDNPCTNDICNPDCTCANVPNIAPCDDGLICNGSDTCGGGSCSIHSGNPCPADVDGDNAVGAADLALLLGAWGSTAAHPADINCDGVVGAADLALLLGVWGSC